jgi:FkbM family methyltransferase
MISSFQRCCTSILRILALDEVISRHGQIDVLKVDIEGLEDAVVTGVPDPLARHIRKIYVECVSTTTHWQVRMR